MQLLRLVAVEMHNKPVYGYKRPKQIEPEQYFGLPGDKKKKKIPQLTKEQFKKATKKAKLLKGVI